MEDRAIRGVSWTLLSVGLNKVVTFATNIALARLLVPDDFGLFALAMQAGLFILIFRDLGLGAAIIVRRDFGDHEKAVVLTGMMLLGVLSAVLLVAVSPLVALVLDEPRLIDVLAAISITLVLGGVTWSYETIMQREMAFRERFIALFIQAVSYAVVSLALAANGAGVWALVGGSIATGVVGSVAFVALSPYRLPLRFDRAILKEALVSGRGFIAQGMLHLTRYNIDYLIVGRVLGSTPLGVYYLSFRLSELTTTAIADPVAKVTFPSFAAMRHEGQDVTRPYLATLRMIGLVCCLAGVTLSAAADPFTAAVLGPKWSAAVGPLTVLGIWAAVRPLEATTGWLLNSAGRAGLLAKLLGCMLLLIIPGFVLAAMFGNLTTVACVALADMLIAFPVTCYFAASRLGIRAADQWQALRPIAYAVVPTWVAGRLVANALQDSRPVVALTASVAAAVLVYAATITLTERGALPEALRQIRRMTTRSGAVASDDS